MNLSEHAFIFPESAVSGGYLLATYYMEIDSGENVLEKAAGLAVGQTIGTWTVVPGITAEMLDRHMGKVVAIYDVPPTELKDQLPTGKRAFIVQIAFPEINIGPQFPMLLTALLGNDVSTSAQIKLVDIQVSPELAAGFGGPRFGIQGIRELTGVAHRPLILNVLKPCTGFPPEAGVSWFEDSARGGSDVIKDDELLSNPSFNQLSDRVRLYRQAAERVYDETGHRTLYCTNITDRADKLLENARRAAELGADLVMINAVAAGLGAVQAVAALPDFDLPILVHFAAFASLTEAQRSGVTSPLFLGKMMRLAGADATSFTSPYSAYPLLREKFIRTAQYMQMPLYDLKPTLPVPGGGIHPVSAVSIVRDLGPDIMLTVGGAIQGHPGGSAAGVKAMRASLEATMEGTPLEEKAKDCPELKVAIERWGG
jgi:2,3-diketo-5-methylthiopentyl-1-phosphate enolase